ncbi:MAG: general secretion pathway protein GspK [Opitutales bacterium]|jgi:hypothetical protein
MTSSNANRIKKTRGSVIVLVLVFVILLTFIVVAFLEEATDKIKYYGLFHNRDDLRTDAYSAMEISLAVLNQYIEIENSLWGPAQGWGDPLKEAGFQPAHANSVTVSFTDESAKLPLASLEYDDLLVLFDVLGFDLPEAQELADALIDWTDEDDLRRLNGFDGEDYEDMDPPYRPSNSPIVSWDEFQLIKPFRKLFWDESGQPNELWPMFRSMVSLYHTGKVNINQSNDLTRLYLEEKGLLDMRALDYFMNGADSEPGTEDDRLLRAGQGSEGILLSGGEVVTDSIELLRVLVEARRGEANFTLEALVTWSGSNPSAAASPDSDATREPSKAEAENVAETAQDERNRARGDTRTAPAAAAKLGYPFRFVRLTENRKF